jgi:phage shock protein PspC (stress-responsive transcriptional regulator)
MKKILTVNLNRKVFHIEEDACLLLDRYLHDLRRRFGNEQGAEAKMNGFEARIEALLSEKTEKESAVVSFSDVESVIRQMGRPEDFGTDAPQGGEKDGRQSFASGEPQENGSTGRRKLYRDLSHKLIGGVCSGFEASFGWDATWVRVAAILLFITGFFFTNIFYMPGWIVVLYIVLWAVVPASGTALQWPEAPYRSAAAPGAGGKTAEQARANVSNYDRNSGCLSAFLKVCLAIFAVITGIPVLFLILLMLAVLLAILLAAIFGVGIFGGLNPFRFCDFSVYQCSVTAVIGGFLFIGIPLVSLIYAVLSAICSWKPVRRGVKIAALLVWILSIFLLLFSVWKKDRPYLWLEWPGVRFELRDLRYWENDSDTQDGDRKRLDGDGNITARTETFPDAVKKLEIKGYLKINLEMDSLSGSRPELTVEGDSNIINHHLDIRQSGEKILLGNKQKYDLKQSARYRVILRTSGLEKLEVTGAVNMETAGLNMDNLDIKTTGVSHVEMSYMDMENLTADCSGASAVILAGHAAKVSLKATGVSHIQAGELTADTVYAGATGAGRIECNPVVFLDAKAKGVSHITFHSEPESKSVVSTGAARINVK